MNTELDPVAQWAQEWGKRARSERKIILFYRERIWGVEREYVVDPVTATLISSLIGSKTVNPRVRETIRDLTGGLVTFQETLKPQ